MPVTLVSTPWLASAASRFRAPFWRRRSSTSWEPDLSRLSSPGSSQSPLGLVVKSISICSGGNSSSTWSSRGKRRPGSSSTDSSGCNGCSVSSTISASSELRGTSASRAGMPLPGAEIVGRARLSRRELSGASRSEPRLWRLVNPRRICLPPRRATQAAAPNTCRRPVSVTIRTPNMAASRSTTQAPGSSTAPRSGSPTTAPRIPPEERNSSSVVLMPAASPNR